MKIIDIVLALLIGALVWCSISLVVALLGAKDAQAETPESYIYAGGGVHASSKPIITSDGTKLAGTIYAGFQSKHYWGVFIDHTSALSSSDEAGGINTLAFKGYYDLRHTRWSDKGLEVAVEFKAPKDFNYLDFDNVYRFTVSKEFRKGVKVFIARESFAQSDIHARILLGIKIEFRSLDSCLYC